MKKIFFLLLGLLIIVVVGYGLLKTKGQVTETGRQSKLAEEEQAEDTKEKLIGGERDENGCLGPAGYSFDEEVNACTRSWELDQEQTQAAKAAVAFVGPSKGLTVVSVEKAAEDNFFVFLQKDDLPQEKIEVKNGQVVETEE